MTFRRPSSSRIALWAAIGVASWAAPGCAPEAKRAGGPDVLLLTIDTMRADRWGCLGDRDARTPHLDRLARGGLLAFEGRAPAPITLPSHASILTGLAPAEHGVRDNGIFRFPSDQGETLAERLRASGWTTAAFVSAYPLARRFGLDRGFDRYDSNLGEGSPELGGMRQRTAGDTVERVNDWLGGARGQAPDSGRPLFLWVHFFDPHADYVPPSPWRALFPGDGYRGEVAYVDTQAARLLRVLGDRRPGVQRVLVVTADHGEGLWDHGESTHGALVHATTIRVPIVLRRAEYAPELLVEPCALERIPASILETVRLDARLNPGSAPPMSAPPTATHAETLYPFYNFGWAGLRSRDEGGWRLIAGPVDRLYRIADDPGETRNLAAERPDVVAAMRSSLEAEWGRRTAHAFVADGRELSSEDVEALRALGYLASDGMAADGISEAFRGGVDPQDRLADVDRINRALTLLHAGDAQEAVRVLRAVVADDSTNQFAYRHLGQAAFDAGRFRLSRDSYRRSIALGPGPDAVYRDLARAEMALGELDAAHETLMAAMAINPESSETHHRLSTVYARQGRLEPALEELHVVVELRPRYAEAWSNIGTLCEALGRRDEAIAAWKRVLEIEERGPVADIAREGLSRLGEGGGPR